MSYYLPPFLTIYTPTYARPGMLEKCKQSVCAQTLVESIQHLIIEDRVGIGIGGMFTEIGRHIDEIRGEWVYVLQDDDMLADENCAADLRTFEADEEGIDVIMVRNFKRGNKQPLGWEIEPFQGLVDLGSYVVRRQVFAENVGKFLPVYHGDYTFIRALWDKGCKFAWFDRVFAREQVQTPGLGRSERMIYAEL